jgi:hypothetical protein
MQGAGNIQGKHKIVKSDDTSVLTGKCICVVCVNGYDVYDKCEKSTHAYDYKRARVNAHVRVRKVQQSIKKAVAALLDARQHQAAAVLVVS